MIGFNRLQQSRAHLSLSRALGITQEAPETTNERALAEYAYVASRSPESLAEGILLASALREHAGQGSFSFVMKDLSTAAGSLELAQSAGRLIGGTHIGRGIWSTNPDQDAQRVEIQPHLLRDYLEDWAGYLPASG